MHSKAIFREKILSLRPYIIAKLHENNIIEYNIIYAAHNDGKTPQQSEINNFISQLISNGRLLKEADEIINEYVDFVFNIVKKEHRKKRYKYIIIDSTILVLMLTVIISYIFVYLNQRFGYELIPYEILLHGGIFISAIVSVLLLTVYFVAHIYKNITSSEYSK